MLNVGIYQIRNLVNGDLYIGQSSNLKSRKYYHFYDLRKNKHGNPHLQFAYNLYGSENFVFEILLYCEPFELTRYEQGLVDRLDPAYNIQKECVSSSLGIKHTDETKQKIRENRQITSGSCNPNFGKKHSEETRQKISISTSGSCNSNFGKKHSDEARQKMSDANKGKTQSEETKQKISDAQKGIPKTDEAKQKTSDAMKLSWKNRNNSF